MFEKLLLLFTMMGLAACSTSHDPPAPVVEGWKQESGQESAYVVQDGDSVYSIAWAFGMDYRDIARYNHLSPPYTIHPGQRLQMSMTDSSANSAATTTVVTPVTQGLASIPSYENQENPAPAPKTASQSVVATPPVKTTKPTSVANTAQPTPATVASTSTSSSGNWLWPTKGKVTEGFSKNPGGNRGIDITGHLGQPVVASAAGKVVYAGSGMRGYGKLIIVKHNDNDLSAYAFNRVIIVKEGQTVKRGQKIAEMGQDDAGKVLLHFEIRQNGKPVNPLPYLK